MTNSVTPQDPPLVDPETGETAPLSPQRGVCIVPRYDDVFFEGMAWLDGLAETDEWTEYETTLVAHLESDDGA
jgi:hypothetical protein